MRAQVIFVAVVAALMVKFTNAAPTDVLNLVDVKRNPISVLSQGDTSADNIQLGSIFGPNGHIDEASGQHEENAIEGALALVLGHDNEG